jgi:protein O-mannosyl-transferase
MQPSPETTRASRAPAFWVWLGISAVTLLAYFPVIKGGFIWDDDGHVTRPDLRSLHGLGRIWFELGATQQYYPVLHSAFWMEHRLWGDATVGYHLVNILLHATAAWLFALALRRLAIPGAWLGGWIFALHPVGVESVAWISEQKNTLSTVFYLLAALTYLNFDRDRKRPLYFLGLGLFILAVLSKSVTATLPAALLVVLWWKRGTLSWKRDVLPLIPWLTIGVAGGVLTAWVERRFGGAEGAAYALNFFQRCLLAGRITWFYLGKLFWPVNLIFIYPRWQVSAGIGWQCLFPLGVIGLVATLWLIRKQTRGPLAAVLFFVGSLFPALGFFNVYPFAYSYVADHFQYLASMGIVALVCGGIGKSEKWKVEGGNVEPGGGLGFRFPLSSFHFPQVAALTVICGLGVLTWRQARIYRDGETLYRATIERNPECWMAHTNLGVALAAAGQLPEAISHYERALEIDPSLSNVHNDLGSALFDEGRIPQAIAEFTEALRIRPRYAEAIYNLGVAVRADGRIPAAIDDFYRALQIKPDFFEAHYNLALALADAGRTSEAVVQFEQAVRLKPGFPEGHYNLAVALHSIGRESEARIEFARARGLGFRP